MEAESIGAYNNFEMWCIACDVEVGDTLNILLKPLQICDSQPLLSRGVFRCMYKRKVQIVLETGENLFFSADESDCAIVATLGGIEYACRIDSPNFENPLKLKDVLIEK